MASEDVKGLADVLRALVRQSACESRIARHVLEHDVNNLWAYALLNPETVRAEEAA